MNRLVSDIFIIKVANRQTRRLTIRVNRLKISSRCSEPKKNSRTLVASKKRFFSQNESIVIAESTRSHRVHSHIVGCQYNTPGSAQSQTHVTVIDRELTRPLLVAHRRNCRRGSHTHASMTQINCYNQSSLHAWPVAK